MNRKQLTLLIVVGAILGGLGWVAWTNSNNDYAESSRTLGAKFLPNFPLNDVEQIVIQQGKTSVNLAKQNEVWTVKERGGFPANFDTISEVLRKFWELKVAKPVKTGPSRLPMLELVAPDKGAGTLVEFKDKSGKAINSVLLGAKSLKQAGGDPQFGGGGMPDGRYVMLGSDVKTVSLVAEAFSNVEAKPEDWLDKKEWFKVEKLKSVSVTATNPTNSWKLSRDTEAGEWKLADAKAGELLDNAKSGSATSALSYPSFADVATDTTPASTGMDKAIVARLETFDGLLFTAKIGKAEGENHYFQIAADGQFPTERAPGKDEKPEDKAKLDTEFKDSLTKLQGNLKAYKTHEKWTYIVSKWTVDAFLKERKELLTDKKEEPAAEPKADAKPPLK
jgi:Domain of unknown function (DUF4340)